MTSFVESLLVKHVKLSSIGETKLLNKRISLDDSLELMKSLSKELEGQSSSVRFYEGVGVVVIMTSLVSDIVRDSLGASLSKSNALMKFGLNEIYDKARAKKWQGNRYEKEIEAIKRNGGYLEKLAKLDKTGMVGMTVTIHKNMLANMTGLLGYVEDSKEAQRALINSIKSLHKNIDALEKARRNVQFYLDTGDGGASQQRFTPAQQAVSPGQLR